MKSQQGNIPNSAMCTVENLMEHVTVNQTVSVVVVLKNNYGQAVPGRGESITVILSSERNNIMLPQNYIEDKRNGRYKISFFLNHIGDHQLNICVYNNSILGMPHRYINLVVRFKMNFVIYWSY